MRAVARPALDILPTMGLGPIRFGMSKARVRADVGAPETEFVRNPEFAPDHVEWIYWNGTVYITFNPDGQCSNIMVSAPAQARLEGVDLLSLDAPAAWNHLRRIDPDAYPKHESLVSAKLGVAIYAPNVGTEFEDPGDTASAIILFTPDNTDWA